MTLDVVAEVRELIEGISSASRHQHGEVTKIHAAMGRLDDMTQHNAGLVEQTAAATEMLKHQAARLETAVNTFPL